MSRKNLIYDFKPLTAGDMSQASLVGLQTDVSAFDSITYNVTWTGGQTTNGIIGVQYSKDGLTWYLLDFGATIALNTDSDSHRLVITEVGFKFTRPVYTRTNGSATGTLDISIFCTTKGA